MSRINTHQTKVSTEHQLRSFLFMTVYFCVISLIFPNLIFAQDQNQSQVQRDIEQLINDFDPEETDLDLEQLLEQLQDLAANPLNINRASIDDFLQVPGLNFRLAQEIVSYRKDIKPFETVDELQNVSGIGAATLNRIRPYVRIGEGLERGRDYYLNANYWTSNSRTEATTRYQQVLQKQEGYSRPDSLGGYLGNPAKIYQRFRYTSNHLSLTLTQDKDPGEPLTGPVDFDYTSWHIALRNNGKLNELIIGDYSVGFGQGLTLWSGGSFGKGSEVIRSVNKNERGVRTYTSAQETNAFRGVAFSYGERFQLSGFYSNRRRTASEIDETRVRFPTESALHRTINERERRLNLVQETVGGRLRYQSARGFFGFTGYQNRFSRPVAPGTQPYQIFNFYGSKLSAIGADYRFMAGPSLLFGEIGYTDNSAWGLISGATIDAGPSTAFTLAYRFYEPGFQSIFGAGFGEQSGNPQNEEGFYLGAQHGISESITVSAYMDHFRFPAARFQTRQPTSGYDWLTRIEYAPTRDFDIYLLIRYKQREQEFTDSDSFGRELRLLDDNKRTGARLQAAYQVHPTVRLRTRFDFTRARAPVSDPTYGYLIFQDIRYTPLPNLTIDGRITMFETDDFNSRVFQFENDLLGVLSNTMLFDQGQRMYIVISYRSSDWFQVWLKASTTVYENRNTIGSGLQEILGDRRSDIGLQARIRF